jgi:16S rRNA (uracil1498-N3)-methyltransferase
VPSVQAPWELPEFFGQSKATTRLILVERMQGGRLATITLPAGPTTSVVVVVGPEGGWYAEEIAMARELAFEPITLGATILRSETASLAALAVLQSRLGLLG